MPSDRPEIWPAADEDLCYLCGDWRILQRVRGHRWSLDDLVTAWFAAQQCESPPSRFLDLGCGIGAVLLLLAWYFPQAHAVGIEAQAISAALARRSIAWNGIINRCTVHLGDLRDSQCPSDDALFDLITGTPPYLPLGSATVPSRLQNAGCHLERRGGIEAYCQAAARRLSADGAFVVCHAAPQRTRVEAAAAAAGLSIISRRDIIPRCGKAALFAVYAMRHGAGRTAVVLPPLIVRDADGVRTREFQCVRSAMGMPP